jgi:hypothetical protein
MFSGNVFVKAEHLNPGGSIKDRVAKHIIESAGKDGKLKPGMTIEATSVEELVKNWVNSSFLTFEKTMNKLQSSRNKVKIAKR